jgi:predicted DNA-binding ArsR family transcriptional regulator
MKNTMKSQLIEALKRGWITPADALLDHHCMSLSQRCGELKRAGYQVIDEWRHGENGKRWKAYRIAEREWAV